MGGGGADSGAFRDMLSTFPLCGKVEVGEVGGEGRFSIASSAALTLLGAWHLWLQEGCLCRELLHISVCSWSVPWLRDGSTGLPSGSLLSTPEVSNLHLAMTSE